MLAININNWGNRKPFGGDVVQAAQVDSVYLTTARDITYAERAHSAMSGEIVFIAHGVEQILS